MRLTTFIFIVMLFSTCTGTNKTAKTSNRLNGTWIPVREEIGGASLPTSAFEKQQLIIRDTTYTFVAESTDMGVLKWTNDKMDIYGKEGVNSGKHFTAIYKFVPDSLGKKERLVICYNLKGDNYPETFETKGQRNLFLSVFQKHQ